MKTLTFLFQKYVAVKQRKEKRAAQERMDEESDDEEREIDLDLEAEQDDSEEDEDYESEEVAREDYRSRFDDVNEFNMVSTLFSTIQ